MTVPPGRRERKKAATRQKIADAAMRLFLERGYDAVGIRDVAAEADVAVTTLFSHFASKEALVFEQDQDFEQRLTRAVTDRDPHEPLIPALRREIEALLRHCGADSALPIWQMVDESPALRQYEGAMRLRHAESVATAIAGALDLPESTTSCRTIARFAIDAFSLAREAADPDAALNEIFQMIEAAWEVSGLPWHGRGTDKAEAGQAVTSS
ncbi:TetR/AcrR family transcriptional regulator [Actinomadura terrae]|uniref:TetR/AcrR family transcriptional regulator n=1 Tax=Actinomadura terrae TaxID=604353 RepID=UPI001FA746B0|nr:TetR/AcrR family transcriptional regulator [Actinomadura terrae]